MLTLGHAPYRVSAEIWVLYSTSDDQGWICKLCKQIFKDRQSPTDYLTELRQHAASASHRRCMQVTFVFTHARQERPV